SLDQTTDKLVAAADAGKAQASDARLAAQSATSMLVIGIIGAVILLCCVVGLVLGRSITRQIGGITGAMRELAAGDTSITVP
ncbi:hypothetical protein ABTF80_21610, partial [Acinetobacter baumannii]